MGVDDMTRALSDSTQGGARAGCMGSDVAFDEPPWSEWCKKPATGARRVSAIRSALMTRCIFNGTDGPADHEA